MAFSPADIHSSLPRIHQRVAIATVENGLAQAQVWGLPHTSDFEIGSVSKGITGLLYADAIERGLVETSTRVDELLPLEGTAAGSTTLGALATHSSGLPRLALTPPPRTMFRRNWRLIRHGENPYGDSLDEFLDQLRPLSLGKPEPLYSNIGFALLGHAVAAAQHTDYGRLLTERLGATLPDAYIASTPEDLRDTALLGTSKSGKPRQAWTGAGIAPAGGVRAHIDAASALLQALTGGTAPGIKALDPVTRFGRGSHIGAAWITMTTANGPVTFHNGMTGGFASWLGVDREHQRGLVILTAHASSVDRQAFAALAQAAQA